MAPYTRHEEVPVFEHRPGGLDANRFNRVCLALKRAGGALRFELPTLRHLDLILQEDAWIVVDRDLNDVPLVAWTAFEVDAEQPRPGCCSTGCSTTSRACSTSGWPTRTRSAVGCCVSRRVTNDLQGTVTIRNF
ncbi:MAG: hypothetical protein GWP66_06505 [Gammaproteobacteria bacterium]|nr:hypothetical protein [Gammaproteobacteria bacterium]